MQILKLMLFASKPLNDLYKRPYNTIVTQEGINALDQATKGGTEFSQTAITKTAGHFIQMSAQTEGIAPIVNGWGTPRFRFLMEVIENHGGLGQNKAYYVGHTDYMEGATIDRGGNVLIDNNLQFYINAVHRFRINGLYNGNQLMGEQMSGNGFNQILYNRDDNQPIDFQSIQQGNVGDYKIRPVDVFRSRNTLNQLSQYGLLNGITDSNTLDATGTLLTGSQLSSRRNTVPGTYMFDIMKGYREASATVQSYGGDESDAVREAISIYGDGYAYQDPLFTELRDVVDNIQWRGVFNWGQLNRVFPYVNDICTVCDPSQLSNMRNQFGQQSGIAEFGNVWDNTNTAYWVGANMETVAASLLANAIPTILLENLASEIRFTMTNMTVDGQIQHATTTFVPLTNMVDTRIMLDRVLSRIQTELVPMVSQYGAIPFTITVDSSIYGDTMVNISLNGQPAVPYVMPTFADNAASPILTSSVDRFNHISNDLYRVASYIGNQTGGTLSTPTVASVYTPPSSPMQPTQKPEHGFL